MPDGQRAGFPVFWREFGTGPEQAVLLHCALGHSKMWTPLAEALADRLSMIAPDMPGHGRSGAWDYQGDIHDQVTAIARECLGCGGHVIGHSFGATVALRLALEDPGRVKTLTLIEPVLFAAAGQSDPAVLQQYTDQSQDFGKALAQGHWSEAAADFIGIWGDGRPWNGLNDREKTLFASQMPFILQTEALLMQDTKGLLHAGGLEAISCPTLLVQGQATDPVIPAIHATLERRIPNAVNTVVDGAGHMVPLTHPDVVARNIEALLDA